MRSPSNGIRVLSVVCLIFATSICALSQTTTGRIVGNVSDPSGATVGGATITITDVQRNISRTITTDASGEYVAPELQPGDYKVQAQAKGFKSVERVNIVVSVAEDLRVDITLPPGQVSEMIVVTEEVPLVNSESATLGGTLTNAEINDLPLSGRNYENLLQLRPGDFLPPAPTACARKTMLISSKACSTASRTRGKPSSTAPASLEIPPPSCPLMPFRNSTSSKILPPNMDGSPVL
jgi:hypothetical protein